MSLFILLWWQLMYSVGNYKEVETDETQRIRLECSPEIYPQIWFWLFLSDFVSGLISVILHCFYDKELNLEDGSDRSERELKNLIVFIAG